LKISPLCSVSGESHASTSRTTKISSTMRNSGPIWRFTLETRWLWEISCNQGSIIRLSASTSSAFMCSRKPLRPGNSRKSTSEDAHRRD
jgi:hypothetical protein